MLGVGVSTVCSTGRKAHGHRRARPQPLGPLLLQVANRCVSNYANTRFLGHPTAPHPHLPASWNGPSWETTGKYLRQVLARKAFQSAHSRGLLPGGISLYSISFGVSSWVKLSRFNSFSRDPWDLIQSSGMREISWQWCDKAWRWKQPVSLWNRDSVAWTLAALPSCPKTL